MRKIWLALSALPIAAATALLISASPAGANNTNAAKAAGLVRLTKSGLARLYKDDTSKNSQSKFCFYSNANYRNPVATADPGSWGRFSGTSVNDVISSHKPC